MAAKPRFAGARSSGRVLLAPLVSRGRSRLTALVLLLVYLPACHSWRTETVAPQVVIEAKHPDQIRIVRADGTKQVVHQPAVVADTLRGTPGEPVIPMSDVRAVETRRVSGGRTMLLVVGGGLGAALFVCALTQCLNVGWGP